MLKWQKVFPRVAREHEKLHHVRTLVTCNRAGRPGGARRSHGVCLLMALLIRTAAELQRLSAMVRLLLMWTAMYQSMGSLEEAFSALELSRVMILELRKPSRRWVWQLPHVPLLAARLHRSSQNSGLPCTSLHATPSIPLCALVVCTPVVRLSRNTYGLLASAVGVFSPILLLQVLTLPLHARSW